MSATPVTPRSDARLWLTAILLSLGLNVAVVLVLALMVVHSLIFVVPEPEVAASPPEEERLIEIVPSAPAEAPPDPDQAGDRGFVRTSPDQASEPAEAPAFIGERDTQAASDAEAVVEAPALPSQDGIEPRVGEVELTESDYQDGDLAHEADGGMTEPQPLAAAEAPPDPGEAGEPPLDPPAEGEGETRVEETQPPPDRLLEGPLPVDRPVPMEQVEEEPKPTPREEVPEVVEQPKPKTGPGSPGFRGNQQKTRLKGSISRRGTSALDVEDSELGRYHASLCRAIEKAWQRKMFANRDVLLPGVLRIQIVLDGDGRVRSVSALDEVGGSRIQRGLTMGAIREADLPKMPAAIKRELDGEPLELLYNFIF